MSLGVFVDFNKTFGKLVDDVVKDYNRRLLQLVNAEVVKEPMLNHIRQYTGEFDLGDYYAVCMKAMYYLDKCSDHRINGMKRDKIDACLDDFFSEDIDILIDTARVHRWLPEVVERAIKFSSDIYKIAQNSYDVGITPMDIQTAGVLLSQLNSLYIDINRVNCTYESREYVLEVYNREKSESELDMKLINGDKKSLSKRMEEYISNSIRAW